MIFSRLFRREAEIESRRRVEIGDGFAEAGVPTGMPERA
jgi:hypothetical protein